MAKVPALATSPTIRSSSLSSFMHRDPGVAGGCNSPHPGVPVLQRKAESAVVRGARDRRVILPIP